MIRRGAAIAGWIAVVLVAAGLHPALREGAPLSGLGRQIAEDAAQGRDWLGTLGLPGGHAPLAFWALNLSLLYIAGWGLFRLCPAREPAGESSPALLVAALAGQVAAIFATSPTGFYFLSAGVAALALFVRRESVPPTGRPWAACGVGLAFVLIASPLDPGLAYVTGASMLPEAWFPLAVEFETRWPVGIALAVALAAACGAVGRSGHWLGLAPACVLIFGPSNPAKGLATAAVVALLARSGAPPAWRAVFVASTIGLFVALAVML